MDEKAIAAHAAWKAACEATRLADRAASTRQHTQDESMAERLGALDALRTVLYEKQRLQSLAFQAMSDALPEAGKHAMLTVQQHVALEPFMRVEHAAVKVWLKADYGDRWYAAVAHYDVDTRTGERHLGVTWLCDDAVDEAARRNARYAEYYARKGIAA